MILYNVKISSQVQFEGSLKQTFVTPGSLIVKFMFKEVKQKLDRNMVFMLNNGLEKLWDVGL